MTLNEAYEKGDHDERSIHLYEYIAHLDYSEGDDSMGFSSGGDGDNGEALMYLLDCYFAHKDKQSADKAGL